MRLVRTRRRTKKTKTKTERRLHAPPGGSGSHAECFVRSSAAGWHQRSHSGAVSGMFTCHTSGEATECNLAAPPAPPMRPCTRACSRGSSGCMRLARSTSNSSMNCSLSSRNLAPACLRYLRRTQRGATAAGLWPRVLRCLRCGSQGMGRWAAGRRAGALLQDGCQAPALQLAHAADHSARPVAAQVAHDDQRIVARVE